MNKLSRTSIVYHSTKNFPMVRLNNHCFLAFVLAFHVHCLRAQDSLTVSFEGLAPGQPLGEQFAPQGVHFHPLSGYPTSTVIASPPLNPSGQTVATGSFWITFDTPIVSFQGVVAQPFVPGTFVSWLVLPVDPQGRLLTPSLQGSFPADEWSSMQVNFRPDSIVQGVWLRGYRFSSENLPSSIMLENFSVTFVPEPATWTFFGFGCAAVFLLARRGYRTNLAA